MTSKRKREIDEDVLQTPNAKIAKQEEVTRSGRVRKKPAKFVDEVSEDLGAELIPKSEPVKIVSSPKPKQAQHVTVSPPVTVTPPPQPVTTKIVTIPDPVKIEEEIMAMSEIKMEEESHSAARSGRARKKSAKVLEMEEFEEAEKKQTTKKELGKKLKSPTSPTPGMKAFPKSPTSGVPTTVAKLLSSPASTLKIKDIQTSPKVETLSPQNIPTSPGKVSPGRSSSKSPTAAGALSSPSSSKGSVIKLLLSSPAQSTSSMISAGAVSQASPPTEKPAKKKSKAKEKSAIADDHAKIKQALEMAQAAAAMSPVKQELTVNTTHMMKTSGGGLKIKMTQVKKDPSPGTAKAAGATLKTPPKEPKGKKGKKSTPKDESVFLPPPLPSPNVIHVGPMSMGLEMKSDVEFMQQKKKGKGKGDIEKQKAKDKLDMEEAIIDHEFGLDMSDINLAEPGEDSFMDIDDDDSLMIPDSETEVKPKLVKKKKAVKSRAGGKLGHMEFDDMPADSDLVMDLSRMKSDDKRKKKAIKEVPEETEKNSSKKKRAPTAYMLWCNENRPKVVMENPGIDFSTISKTLGEMWSSLPEKEKLVWKRKAKKAAGKGSTLITTGKTGAQKAAMSQAMAMAKQGTIITQKQSALNAAALITAKQAKQQVVDDIATPVKGFGIDPVDVAAHLKIVGESLSIIGMRLQEHRTSPKCAPSAYTLWCNENRPKVVMENPGIDISTISKTLVDMWSSVPRKEKLVWIRKAKKARLKKKKRAPKGYMLWCKENRPKVVMENPGIDFSEVSEALWSSLPLKEKQGLIAVQGSLSVLLDSMLCAVAPLLCLTAILPETNGLPYQTHMKNLDNIAYVMPGL